MVGTVAILVVLVAIGALGWAIVATTSTREVAAGAVAAGPSTPATEWDPRLEPLARVVEQTRGKPFLRPVPAEFLDDEAFVDAVQGEASDLTDEDRTSLDVSTAQLRALGLIAADVDLRSLSEQLVGGGTLAYYDTEAERIIVKGQELDELTRSVVVHELTHAWQDQYTDLDRIDQLDDVRSSTLRTVAEGDATVVEDTYVDGFSSAELRKYEQQQREVSAEARSALVGVPDLLQALFTSPYVVGPGFVRVLDGDGGNSAIDQALVEPPAADIELMLPERYLEGPDPVDVAPPSIGPGQEQLDRSEFGALSLLVTLAQRVDPRRSLDAVDGWAGDASTTYRDNGRSCIAISVVGVDPSASDRLATTFSEWVTAGPAGAASVERAGDTVLLRSCEDPAAVPAPGEPATIALQYVGLRLTLLGQTLEQLRVPIDQAACFADNVVERVTPEELVDGSAVSSEEGERRGATAATACFN